MFGLLYLLTSASSHFCMCTYSIFSPPVSCGGFHWRTALSLLSSLTNRGPWGRLGGPRIIKKFIREWTVKVLIICHKFVTGRPTEGIAMKSHSPDCFKVNWYKYLGSQEVILGLIDCVGVLEEIVEEMKLRDREERGTEIKVKKQKK